VIEDCPHSVHVGDGRKGGGDEQVLWFVVSLNIRQLRGHVLFRPVRIPHAHVLDTTTQFEVKLYSGQYTLRLFKTQGVHAVAQLAQAVHQ
jgi:hypothetical protein